jgi:hypothetical protein
MQEVKAGTTVLWCPFQEIGMEDILSNLALWNGWDSTGSRGGSGSGSGSGSRGGRAGDFLSILIYECVVLVYLYFIEDVR